jgi:NADPH:quinone reductase-like Zn-dependent oxidoreductase
MFLRFKFGLFKPRKPILGNYLSGIIEAVGSAVEKFQVGDEIFAYSDQLRGTYSEYLCLSESYVIFQKPENLTFEETAAIPYGGCNALHFLKRVADIKGGQKVLIYGASGAIGSSAIQLAKYFGAEVTGVCSTTNIELVKSLGSDSVIDYIKEDFTQGDKKYDLIFDAVGKLSNSKCQNNLSESGKYVSVFSSGDSKVLIEDFILLKELAEKKKIIPVIDRCYSLEQTNEAHRYADKNHTKGIVIVQI